MITTTSLMLTAFAESKKSWGGITINLHTMEVVKPTHGFGVSVTDTIEVSEDIDLGLFETMFNLAAFQFIDCPYFGVFHDDEKHTIEFNGVEIVETKHEVDLLGQTYPITGGAYNFATGNGYWPQPIAT